MGLSRLLSPERDALADEEEVEEEDDDDDEDASEEETAVDSADPWIMDRPLGERFRWRASAAPLLQFQDSGVSNFCPVTLLSTLPS